MSGYGAFSGFAVTAFCLAIILISIVSLIGAASRRLAVDEGRAGIRDLCELTGISNPKELQDVFGPPDMHRIWRHVTWYQVVEARRPAGHLISGQYVNWLAIGLAVAALFYTNELTLLFVFFAGMAKTGGIILARRLPR